MPIIRVPEKGLKLEGFDADSSAGPTMPNAIAVTLTNGMIEDMIKCVQNGKPIQLSLGPQPVSLSLSIVVGFWWAVWWMIVRFRSRLHL